MPYSSNIFDSEIHNLFSRVNFLKVLDIGPGAGKYADAIRERKPETYIECIEIDSEYVEQFDLHKKYNKVSIMNCIDLINPEYYDMQFDLIILGDVIEHLRKSDGIDLLNFLVYRTKWILLQYPIKYIQNSVDGHHSEAHISVWSKIDFSSFDHTVIITRDNISTLMIKGYLGDDNHDILEVNKIFN